LGKREGFHFLTWRPISLPTRIRVSRARGGGRNANAFIGKRGWVASRMAAATVRRKGNANSERRRGKRDAFEVRENVEGIQSRPEKIRTHLRPFSER